MAATRPGGRGGPPAAGRPSSAQLSSGAASSSRPLARDAACPHVLPAWPPAPPPRRCRPSVLCAWRTSPKGRLCFQERSLCSLAPLRGPLKQAVQIRSSHSPGPQSYVEKKKRDIFQTLLAFVSRDEYFNGRKRWRCCHNHQRHPKLLIGVCKGAGSQSALPWQMPTSTLFGSRGVPPFSRASLGRTQLGRCHARGKQKWNIPPSLHVPKRHNRLIVI